MILYRTFSMLSSALQLLSYVLLIYWLVSLVAPRSPAADWMRRILEPFLAPFRKLAMKAVVRWGAPFDFTLLFAMIALQIASRVLWWIFRILA